MVIQVHTQLLVTRSTLHENTWHISKFKLDITECNAPSLGCIALLIFKLK
jgi:hypothetical protein